MVVSMVTGSVVTFGSSRWTDDWRRIVASNRGFGNGGPAPFLDAQARSYGRVMESRRWPLFWRVFAVNAGLLTAIAVLDEVRRISSELRPGMLERVGLASAPIRRGLIQA
jgi:hypothetical protein